MSIKIGLSMLNLNFVKSVLIGKNNKCFFICFFQRTKEFKEFLKDLKSVQRQQVSVVTNCK